MRTAEEIDKLKKALKEVKKKNKEVRDSYRDDSEMMSFRAKPKVKLS